VKRSGRNPRVGTDRAETAVLSQAEAVPLVATAGVDPARPEAARQPRGRRRRRARRVLGEMLLDRLPVLPGLPADLRYAHPPDARREAPNLHPIPPVEDDARWSPRGGYSPRTGLDAPRTLRSYLIRARGKGDRQPDTRGRPSEDAAHVGAQRRIIEASGYRIPALAANKTHG